MRYEFLNGNDCFSESLKDSLSPTLRAAEVPIQEHSKCERTYNARFDGNEFFDENDSNAEETNRLRRRQINYGGSSTRYLNSMLCAGDVQNNIAQDACHVGKEIITVFLYCTY